MATSIMVNRLAVIAIAVILAALTAATQAQNLNAAACPMTGPAHLDFTLKDLNGKEVRLSAYKGKVIVLNFWATWCAPCRIEIPGFKDLYNRYRRRGVEVIGIAVDEPVSTVEPYAREMKMNYPVLIEQERHDVHDAYGLVGLPTTIIINRDGTICRRHVGFTRKATLEESIRRLL